jgi:RimJ/RimL family protein N-acetyltransferase
MDRIKDFDELTGVINEVINDERESKLIAYSFKSLPKSKVMSKCHFLDDWGMRLIRSWEIKEDYKEVIDGVYLSEAIAHYQTPTSKRGNLFYRRGKLSCFAIRDKDNQYCSLIDWKEDIVYLMLTEINPLNRNQGLMTKAVDHLKKFAFDYACATRILARADIPNGSIYKEAKSFKEDWRSTVNEDTGKTLLYEKWLSFKNSYPIDRYDEHDKHQAFAILNTDILKEEDPMEFLGRKGHLN